MLVKSSANYKKFTLPQQIPGWTVKFALERMLKNCPTYAPEDEWLEEQQLERDKEQVWRALNDKV